MKKIQDYINRLKSFNEQAQTQALLKIVNNRQALLIDLNQQQLYSGRNVRGESLGEYRSKNYAAFKNRLNPLPGFGVWDLKLSGDLYAGMFVEADSFPVTIDSSDPKANKFRDISPFGFDRKSKDEIVQETRPEIQNYYRSFLQL